MSASDYCCLCGRTLNVHGDRESSECGGECWSCYSRNEAAHLNIPLEEYRVSIEDTEQGRSLTDRLLRATIGSCTCETKSPELRYHDELCHYRLFSEALTAITQPRNYVLSTVDLSKIVSPPARPLEQDYVVAVATCPLCQMDWSGAMGYVCARMQCPMQSRAL